MKRVIFSLALLCATPAMAEENKSTWYSYCKSVSDLAETIMKTRQSGVSMASMMEISKGNKLDEGMIIDAFEQPRLHSEGGSRQMIEEFRDKWYAACIKNKPKK